MNNEVTQIQVLSNGVTIPSIGFGTWQTPDGETAVATVKSALEAGYRHIDTAAIYGNEASVGLGIKESGVPREEIFLTSKLWNTERGYEQTITAFNKTLELLNTDYLDLYLIHWPNPIHFRDCWKEANSSTWKALEDLYKAGKIRAIGVSNFRPHHLDALLETAEITPMVNQIRLCPGETQEATVAYCQKHNMTIEAYSPLGVGKIFEVPEMATLAEKYQKSIAQICIRWSLQQGFIPLPKSVTPERILENTKVFDFVLSDEDVAFISSLKGCCGETKDPDHTTF